MTYVVCVCCSAYYIPETGLNIGEAKAFRECVETFLLDRWPVTVGQFGRFRRSQGGPWEPGSRFPPRRTHRAGRSAPPRNRDMAAVPTGA